MTPDLGFPCCRVFQARFSNCSISLVSGQTNNSFPSVPRPYRQRRAGGGVPSDLMFGEEGSCLCASRDPQLLEQVGEIVLDRLITELHRGRNFLVGQSFGHQRQHAPLLRGKGMSLHRVGLTWPDCNPIERPLGEGLLENRLTVETGRN